MELHSITDGGDSRSVLIVVSTWNTHLIIFSFVTALFGCYTALQLVGQVRFMLSYKFREVWLSLTSIAFGACGVWSMHFVGMLALQLFVCKESGDECKLLHITYDPWLTAASLLVAIIMPRVATAIAFRNIGYSSHDTQLRGMNCDRNQIALTEGCIEDETCQNEAYGHDVNCVAIPLSPLSIENTDNAALSQLVKSFARQDRAENDVSTNDQQSSNDAHESDCPTSDAEENEAEPIVNSTTTAENDDTLRLCNALLNQILNSEVANDLSNVFRFLRYGLRQFGKGFIFHVLFSGDGMFVTSWIRLLSSGFVFAVGICSMHYMGMYAMRMDADMSFNSLLVVVSFVIAWISTSIGMWVMSLLRKPLWHALSAVMLAIGICGMHYTGMAAAEYSVTDESRFEALSTSFVGEPLAIVTPTISVMLCFFFVAIIGSNNSRLTDEKRKREQLIANLLPRAVANQLHLGEDVLPREHKSVSIMFADIVGFTHYCAQHAASPSQVAELLNALFTLYDELAQVMGLEKIKTIGDCYIVAAGLPIEREDHAMLLVRFAAEIIRVTQELQEQRNMQMRLAIRIGIHSGPVMAGIFGKWKWQYDVWGDTVSIANQLESSAPPNGIHVSEATKQELEGSPTLRFVQFGHISQEGAEDMLTYVYEPLSDKTEGTGFLHGGMVNDSFIDISH